MARILFLVTDNHYRQRKFILLRFGNFQLLLTLLIISSFSWTNVKKLNYKTHLLTKKAKIYEIKNRMKDIAV